MSIQNNPEIKYKVGSNTPPLSHKKNNSLYFSVDGEKFMKENSNINLFKKNLESTHNPKINTENNILNSNPNINKLLTSTNLNLKRIEINLNKDNSNP